MWCDILTTLNIKLMVLWFVIQHRLVGTCQCFRGTHVHPSFILIWRQQVQQNRQYLPNYVTPCSRRHAPLWEAWVSCLLLIMAWSFEDLVISQTVKQSLDGILGCESCARTCVFYITNEMPLIQCSLLLSVLCMFRAVFPPSIRSL